MGAEMNRTDIFLSRAVEADERAAKATNPQEKQIWMSIAFEYRQYAKMAAEDEKYGSSKVN